MDTSTNSTSAPAMAAPETRSLIAAAVMVAFYFVTSLYIASHRLLWYDEIFTLHIAWLPGFHTLWTALAHAADPPSYSMVVRMFGKLFGHSEVAARLPSTLAMVAGLLLTFDCARRLTDGLHGLIALSVLTCSILPYFGHEARPYAIYFMLAALTFWIWTGTRADGRWPAIFFGVVFFLGVTIHYYFVLCLVPYALWEILRWRPWRPPSPKLIAGVAAVVISVALLYPMAKFFAREFSKSFWARPSLSLLEGVFSRLFPLGFFLLPLIVIWIVVVGARNKNTSAILPMESSESVGWLFLCIPLAGFAVAELKTNAYVSRYFIGALPGIAVAFSCWVWRHFRDTAYVSLGIFLLLMAAGVTVQVSVVHDPEDLNGQSAITTKYLGLEQFLHNDGKRYILFFDHFLYLEGGYYSKYPDECILLLSSGVKQKGSSALYQEDRLLVNLSHYHPLQFWQFDELREHAQETALIQPPPEVLEALKKAGFKPEVRFSEPLKVVYLQ